MEGSNLIQILTFAAMIALSIFIPLIAQGYGASPGLIGLVVGAYNGFFFLSSYVFGLAADRYGGKYILRFGIFASALFFALQILARDFSSLLIVRCLAGAAAGAFPAALTVYAYAEQKGKIGKFAGSGSLGWAMGALLAGLISVNQTIFAMSSIFFVMAFFISLPMDRAFQRTKEISYVPFKLIRRNARIYVPYFFRALGAQAIWSVFPLYLVWTERTRCWSALHISSTCSPSFSSCSTLRDSGTSIL